MPMGDAGTAERPAGGHGPVPLYGTDLSGREAQYVASVMQAGEIGPDGPFRDRFEAEWAVRNGGLRAISVSSGTAALHLGLLALGVGPGDEVIVPAMTYVATANAVRYTGATPVFVDVDPGTWCLDPARCAAAVTARTRAILPVHLFGVSAALAELSAVARHHGIALFADSAHAPLAQDGDGPLGGRALMSAYSFFRNKTLTCGEGGALVVNDADLAETVLQLRAHGLDMRQPNIYRRLGYNYRLSNLACSILCAQLERADAILDHCAALDALYRQLLADVPGVQLQAAPHQARRSPWLFPVVLDPSFGSMEAVIRRLAAQGIQSRPFFPPLHQVGHLAPCHDGTRGPLRVSERLGARGLMLPLHGAMPREAVGRVAGALSAQGR